MKQNSSDLLEHFDRNPIVEDVTPYHDPSDDDYETWNDYKQTLNIRKTLWSSSSACADPSIDTTAFFASSQNKQQEIAHRVCLSCKNVTKCLVYALVAKEDSGVWGAATEKQRSSLLSRLDRKHPRIRRNWNESKEKILEDIAEDFIAQQRAD